MKHTLGSCICGIFQHVSLSVEEFLNMTWLRTHGDVLRRHSSNIILGLLVMVDCRQNTPLQYNKSADISQTICWSQSERLLDLHVQ